MNWVQKIYDIFSRIGAPVGASISADIADIESKVDDLETLAAKTIAGRAQMKAATVDLHNAAGAQTAATCATQEVIIESIVFSPHDDLSDDAGFTGISIETDDTTVQTFVDATAGAKANLTAYSQIAWTGAVRLRVGKKITVTIIGGTATADPSTCDVWITYHAVVDGGTL